MNHLKEWLRNQKEPSHFPRPFSLNVFTYMYIFSGLSTTCCNIWLEVYLKILKIYLKIFYILNLSGHLKI
jgi:uncharacterized integral membrane protein